MQKRCSFGPTSRLLVVCGILAMWSAAAGAADGCDPPPNEDCDGAIIFATTDLPYAVGGLLGCENDVPDKPYWDVFYRYECGVSGEHIFDMCDSDMDTYIRLYVGGCGFSEGDEFAVEDDGCPSSPPNADPQLVVSLEAGVTYWIELGTWRPTPPWGSPNIPYVFNVTLTAQPCEGDVNEDGVVDFGDLLVLLAAWGPCGDPCVADIDGDDDVGFADLLLLLGAWGPCRGL